MADRAPPPSLRPGTSRLTRAATSATGVRRNLFQSRRPTPAEMSRAGANSNSNGGNSNAANNHNNNNNNNHHHNPPPLTTSSSTNSAETLRLDLDVLSETSEIVIRDQNGEFEMEDPPTPPLDDADDEGALDDAQENERERQKLAEAVRHHQINHTRMPVQHEEILDTLKASMRAKVAALAEDNWMYEAEEPPRVH
ncbi:hypothetical protein F5B22DRAFT_238804 [Xylaria bambusicola]|uniref:uncharacterized protein n=1 Tax=Xylaria bambusicola TaxID=326684 RepID=UPI002008C242|nr:uncharacterized protein F5B22DRAFT_238804 [Xylaria bambusicola]KAI0514393.1 hypothetical protein F5B22DRAFT_238804 [Xylaria bambusicola]